MSPKQSTLPKVEITAPVPAPSRMTLAAIAGTRKQEPDRLLLIGVEGVGKSTFSASAPSPIFIAAEDGLAEIDTKAFPEPQSFEDVLAALDVLTNSEHGYKTLAIDTVDWLEPLIWRHLCRKNGWDDIEAPGYGKGYVAALELWRLLLGRLQRLWKERGMEIHLLAHASIVPFQNPAGPDYNRYEAKIHKKAASLVKEWCSTVLFGTYEEFAVDAQKGTATGITTNKKVKGVATGARVIHTQRTAAWDAKNRKDLPPTLPLDYTTYAAARVAGLQVDPAEIYAECLAIASRLGNGKTEQAKTFVESNKSNPVALVKALNRLRTLAAEAGV